jgi:2',3'-cyclic-nucleotide 2'-phosphodiesterase (5'-nucleotidase family)
MLQRLYRGLLVVLFLLQPVAVAYGENREIRILHTNDFHGFAEPYQPLGSNELLGGMAYLASEVNRLRQGKPTVLLAAGDMIQGNNWANLFQGESVMGLMNLMGFDAMVVGNHEFDFGQEVLKKRVSEAIFPVLGANVKGLEGLKPYVTKEVGGIKVGIIGVVTEDTPVSTSPKNVAGLEFLSPKSTVEKYVNELRNKVDLVVVLSHIGFYADRRLAETVKGIDVIVGGHSHTKVAKPVKIGETLIVQAWEHGKVLGVLDLSVENGRVVKWDGHLEEIKPNPGKEDFKVQALINRYGQRIDLIMNVYVGETEEDLDGENVRKAETNLGDLVADIMREVSGADAAIINGGGIRTSIRKGGVKVKDVYSVLPFDNYIVSIRLTGKQIREALEYGFSGIEEEAGRFPQVSGIKITYAPSAPKGSRIRELLIDGKPIDPAEEYRVATNDFMAAGGDGYKAFGEAIRSSKNFEIIGGMMKGEKVVYSNAGRWIRDVVIDYIRAKGKISPRVEDRIVEVTGR